MATFRLIATNMLAAFIVLAGLALGSDTALAQSDGMSDAQARQAARLEARTKAADAQAAMDRALGFEEEDGMTMFGAALFNGTGGNERRDGINSDYRIAPGDKIALRLWGAVEVNEIVTVDAEGNIFIANVGPVNVKDVRAADLQSTVTARLRSVYTSNVRVYATVMTATPVGVYVTGGVHFPGQYAGIPSDSILYFLTMAGGVDEQRGSYRNIWVKRGGQVIATVDLYQFLRSGDIPSIRFQDGDVVLVRDQGDVVTVEGTARAAFGFELAAGEQTAGGTLTALSRPRPETTHVLISGTRNGSPISTYLDLNQFANFQLQDGDQVMFNDDAHSQFITVRVRGAHTGPSRYALAKDATLREALAMIPVDELTARPDAIYLHRESVAKTQRELLLASLAKLEQSVLTAPVRSDGEGEIRVREAELITQFVERAKQTQPVGRVVVTNNGDVTDLRLENGDVIVIPTHTDVITLSGEVELPQAIIHRDGADIDDYAKMAGGYTQRADRSRVLVLHMNGSVETGSNPDIEPGDQVIILPEVETKSRQFAKDVIEIIYQIAVAAGVLVSL